MANSEILLWGEFVATALVFQARDGRPEARNRTVPVKQRRACVLQIFDMADVPLSFT
jgi:hypothetical protein